MLLMRSKVVEIKNRKRQKGRKIASLHDRPDDEFWIE